MTGLYLTQSEADFLIQMPKHRTDDLALDLPDLGGKISVPLTSDDRRESFLLDVSRGRIDLLRAKYQNRGRQTVILVRLDLGGAPHRNPDGEDIQCPHLHIYRDGFADKWAQAPPVEHFQNMGDIFGVLEIL